MTMSRDTNTNRRKAMVHHVGRGAVVGALAVALCSIAFVGAPISSVAAALGAGACALAVVVAGTVVANTTWNHQYNIPKALAKKCRIWGMVLGYCIPASFSLAVLAHQPENPPVPIIQTVNPTETTVPLSKAFNTPATEGLPPLTHRNVSPGCRVAVV